MCPAQMTPTVTQANLYLDKNLKQKLSTFLLSRRTGVLATSKDNKPLCSLMAFAATSDLESMILVSPHNTQKVYNIKANPNVSFLVNSSPNMDQNISQAIALTIQGEAAEVDDDQRRSDLERIFINKHPDLQEFVRSPENAVLRMAINKMLLVENFQAVTEISLKRA